MARKAQSELNINDLDAVVKRAGTKERKLLRELADSNITREGMVLLEILHYFPEARLVQEEIGDKSLRHVQRPSQGQRRRAGRRRP